MYNNFFRRLYVFPVLLVLASCLNQQSSIQEIHSLDQARSILDVADKKTLVVFDLDDTLIYPSDKINQAWFIQSALGKEILKEINDHSAQQKNPKTHSKLIFSKIAVKEKPCTVEPQVISIIDDLKKRGINIIVLSHSFTGSVGIIPSMQELRFATLASVGIDLSTSFKQQEIVFNPIAGKKPVFYNGILLTDFANKGIVLGAFLDAIGYKPRQIIFFDDKEKNVDAVRVEAKARGINYRGFVYKAIEKLPRQYDPDIIEFQRKYLVEHDEYITEEQARELLKK